jgi:spermidine/putrescine transport system substrate-binding protein
VKHESVLSEADGHTRRDVLRYAGSGLAAGTGAATTGCLGGGSEDRPLRVSPYSGAYGDVFEEVVVEGFMDEHGTEVETVPGWDERVTELRSTVESGGTVPYDILGVAGQNYLIGINENLFEPVRYENVPNADDVWGFMREYRTDEYGIPCTVGVSGIMYDEGGPYVEGWDGLPSSDAPVGMDTGYWEVPLLVTALMSEELPGAEEFNSPDAHETLLSEFEDVSQEVDVWYQGGGEVWEIMERGQVDQAVFYYASGRAGIERRGLDYGMMLPDEAPAFLDHFCVTKESPNREDAEKFLNYMLREDVQREWVNEGYYVPANSAVAEDYPDAVSDIYPSTEDGMNEFLTVPDWEAIEGSIETLSDGFNERLV